VVAVVAAAHSTMVGVDIETRCPSDWPDLVPDLVAPGETAPSDGGGFLTLWVRKEAVLKATRDGLSRPMSSVRVSSPPDPPAVIEGAPSLRLVDLDVSALRALQGSAEPRAEVAAALAVDGDQVEISWQRTRI
jgi:phosphopantetheinyl transferase